MTTEERLEALETELRRERQTRKRERVLRNVLVVGLVLAVSGLFFLGCPNTNVGEAAPTTHPSLEVGGEYTFRGDERSEWGIFIEDGPGNWIKVESQSAKWVNLERIMAILEPS